MNKQIIFALCLFALVAVVAANQYGHHYPQYEERRWLQLPALKLKISSDKLLFKLPKFEGLGMRREPEYEHHHY